MIYQALQGVLKFLLVLQRCFTWLCKRPPPPLPPHKRWILGPGQVPSNIVCTIDIRFSKSTRYSKWLQIHSEEKFLWGNYRNLKISFSLCPPSGINIWKLTFVTCGAKAARKQRKIFKLVRLPFLSMLLLNWCSACCNRLTTDAFSIFFSTK